MHMQGADVNTADARGITALGLAVGYNKVPLVKVLIEGGADVSKTDAKGSTALHYAAGRLTRCMHDVAGDAPVTGTHRH